MVVLLRRVRRLLSLHQDLSNRLDQGFARTSRTVTPKIFPDLRQAQRGIAGKP